MYIPDEKKRITLGELSEIAGVTKCTASRILNRNKNFKYAEATVKRIFKIAEENGYRTSQLHKSLFSGKTMSAGIISTNSGSYYSNITRGIHDRLLENNFATLIGINTNNFDDPLDSTEKKVIHRLHEHRVDGFILRPTLENATDKHFKEIIDMKVPLVTFDRKANSEYADYVGSDNEAGGGLAARHLLDLGHINIIQFAGNPACSAYRERSAGFEDELIKQGHIPQTVTCNSNNISAKSEAIFSSKNYPTAVFCHTDAMAGEVYKVLHKLGLKIPEDVSIVGFSNQSCANYLIPELTTIDQQPYKIGDKAAELFLTWINEDPEEKHQQQEVLIDVQLIKRDSCQKFNEKLK